MRSISSTRSRRWNGLERTRALGIVRPAFSVTAAKPVMNITRVSGTISAQRCASSIPSIRSEEHTSELLSLMRFSYAVFFFKDKETNEKYKEGDKLAQHDAIPIPQEGGKI